MDKTHQSNGAIPTTSHHAKICMYMILIEYQIQNIKIYII